MGEISDQWRTPTELFSQLNEEFNFVVDLCAIKENSKCIYYCLDYLTGTVMSNYVDKNKQVDFDLNYLLSKVGKTDKVAFMNPPYSNPKPFIEKAWEDSKHCKIVCLVKCDPSTQWWATFWQYGGECPYCVGITGFQPGFDIIPTEDCKHCGGTNNYRGPKPGCEIRFFPKRVQFDPPIKLVNNGECWKEICSGCDNRNMGVSQTVSYCNICQNKGKQKWVQKCRECKGLGCCQHYFRTYNDISLKCRYCKGKGFRPLSGPSFSCALLVFYRRGL